MANPEIQKNEDLSREEKISAFGEKADAFYGLDDKRLSEGLNKLNVFKVEMQQKLKPDGKRIEDYLFWHILIGSGPSNFKSDLDTPNGEIEKLVDSLIS
jgi:hypothetical protein